MAEGTWQEKKKKKKKAEDRNGGWPMLIEKPEMWEINKL